MRDHANRRGARFLVLFAAVAGAVAALSLGGFGFYLRQFDQRPVAAAVEFRIPRGAALAEVNRILIEAGALPPGRAFIILAKLHGADAKIKAGKYRIDEPVAVARLREMLVNGEVVPEKFTIIEGVRFSDVRAALAADGRLRDGLDEMSDADILRAVGAAGPHPEGLFFADKPHPEGLFFPDTYLFAEGADGLSILRRSHQKMRDLLAAEWRARAPDLPLKNAYEALILASIIEKESAQKSERGLIASVFINRLRRGMRLQADPTVIYGIVDFNGNLTRADLRRDTPYNTYTRAGLPPTPIALPGAESLAAAVRPEASDYLYFVATGEGGAHQFSETLRQHNRAVRKYQKRR